MPLFLLVFCVCFFLSSANPSGKLLYKKNYTSFSRIWYFLICRCRLGSPNLAGTRPIPEILIRARVKLATPIYFFFFRSLLLHAALAGHGRISRNGSINF